MSDGDTSINVNYTAFLGTRMVATGLLRHVMLNVKDNLDESERLQLLIFDDRTGKQIDVDIRGMAEDEWDQSGGQPGSLPDTVLNDELPRRAGRPKLGVVSGEVTLLPRHWEWLKSQPGGASVTLRKLIDEARRAGAEQNKARASQEAAYHFMTAMAGNFPHYEEALRLLYAGDSDRFFHSIREWAPDIRNYIQKLSVDAFSQR